MRLTECVSIEVYEISALSILSIGVINYYHKQFKHAAKKRLDHIFGNPDGRCPGISWTTRTTSTSTPTCPTTSSAPTEEVDFPFLSTYFLSGILKPFRYTEIQKHTFHLKSKDDNKDRQVGTAEKNII